MKKLAACEAIETHCVVDFLCLKQPRPALPYVGRKDGGIEWEENEFIYIRSEEIKT